MTIRRAGCLAVALALATAPVAFGADPPKGSHGQEADTPTPTARAAYSRAVAQVCAHALLFEQPHSIGTRAGALAVAADIRASTRRRLVVVATVPAPPAQRAAVVRWMALERSLADAYALSYVRIYDLIAAPRTPQQDRQAALRLASLMRPPGRLRQAAAVLEQRLRVPDCTGGEPGSAVARTSKLKAMPAPHTSLPPGDSRHTRR